ncbi:hypothetical protein ONE63_003112 [Megalurothrips usitatus]|uniref:Uncharacterized protein n=1 Tax=Megalurothrips usitatus TaxID=439358 RepID=A0AAV7X6C2_9NEOP|nr:hypothetical protein ONE63_003112 [Megalurothrips usitatus]
MPRGSVAVLLALAAALAVCTSTTVAAASVWPGSDAPPPSVYETEKLFIMAGWGWDPSQEATTPKTVALAPAAPPVLAFSASLDYGGQPANYDYARIATLKGFPVDRREGAPAPLQQQHQQHPGRA